MAKGIIRLGFKKIINAASTSAWDTCVFDDTWMEYKMQAANYNHNSKAGLFSTIIRENPAAERLHNSVSAAAIGYIRQLNGIIPGLLNGFEKAVVPFKNFKFHIIQSDMEDKARHTIEILFISEAVTLIDVFNYRYLIAIGDRQNDLKDGMEIETEMIEQVNGLSIYSFQYQQKPEDPTTLATADN